jgi:hypothetical protein
MSLSHHSFRALAPSLPRRQIGERRYVYLREDLLEWLRSRQSLPYAGGPRVLAYLWSELVTDLEA